MKRTPLFATLTALKLANKVAGLHYFSRGAAEFLDSRTHGALIGGRYVVVSRRFTGSDGVSGPRTYGVAAGFPDGRVRGLDDLGQFGTEAEARQAARDIARAEALYHAGPLPEDHPESSTNGVYVTARDLVLTIENYREIAPRVQAMREMLARHILRGEYDAGAAVRAWRYVIDTGARQYQKEFPGLTHTGPEKDLAARIWAAGEAAEFNANRWDMAAPYEVHVLPFETLGGPRTRAVLVVQGKYGAGWDDLDEYPKSERPEALRILGEYRISAPGYPHRLITRRVPVAEAGK